MNILKKLVLYLIVFLSLFAPSSVLGQESFNVTYDTKYQIENDGSAHVEHLVSLANNYSEIYSPSYDFILEGSVPFEIEILENDVGVPFFVKTQSKITIISINFTNAIVGKGKSRTFSIKYKLRGVATQNGQVWDVKIPKIFNPETISSINLSLYIPKMFGVSAYISPDPKFSDSNDYYYVYTFDKTNLSKSGVTAAFGKFQSFVFDINYHLENKNHTDTIQTIALIPDTSFQRVFYTEIKPKPQKILLDEDGNWIGYFPLKSKQSLNIKTRGNVQVFPEPQINNTGTFPIADLQIRESKYWETKDPEIQNLAKDLITPEDIYEYVLYLLDYDYSRINKNAERLGAKGALASPFRSTCREFTDLFIAISRAAGIPAREIIGYAYTENSILQPLSLVTDTLHAWPEYWNFKKKLWIPVDPTWGNTTGGVDYFHRFDLSHVAFTIHGKDAELPLPPGSYKTDNNSQKDVNISFSPPSAMQLADIKLKVDRKAFYIPFLPLTFKVSIENVGQSASYNLPVSYTATGIDDINLPNQSKTIKFLPPYGKEVIEVTGRIPFLRWNSKKLLVISVNGEDISEQNESSLELSTTEIIVSDILLIFSFIILSILFFYIFGRIIFIYSHK